MWLWKAVSAFISDQKVPILITVLTSRFYYVDDSNSVEIHLSSGEVRF